MSDSFRKGKTFFPRPKRSIPRREEWGPPNRTYLNLATFMRTLIFFVRSNSVLSYLRSTLGSALVSRSRRRVPVFLPSRPNPSGSLFCPPCEHDLKLAVLQPNGVSMGWFRRFARRLLASLQLRLESVATTVGKGISPPWKLVRLTNLSASPTTLTL